MSISLNQVQQVEFDSLVKAKYQSSGHLLRSTVRMRTSVEATSVKFRKTGSVIMQASGFQQQVVPQDPGYSQITCNLNKFNGATYVDDIEQWLVNFDEKKEDSQLIADALGRRSDQLILDALTASGTSNVISAGGLGFTFEKLREIGQIFDQNAVPPARRFIAYSAKAGSDILFSENLTSTFFVDIKRIPTGSLNGAYLYGLNWILIPNMDEGGLPISANIRKLFAWDMASTGMAWGKTFGTMIERVPTADSWQILGKMYAGATVIDNVGVVEIQIDESVDPS